MRARPVGAYGSLVVDWVTPAGAWTELRLVRNSYGVPVSQLDGVVMLSQKSGPSVPIGQREAATRSVIDDKLQGGRFQYYAIYLYADTGEWTRAGSCIGLPLLDYGYSNRLWELTPSILRTKTSSLLDADNAELKTFEQIFSYRLDEMRAEMETLRDVNDAEKVSGNLLPVMAQQLGIFFEPELGMKQMRTVLQEAVHLYRNKGTIPGVEGFVSAVSGYGAKVQPLKNLMLDYNDSSFEESIGRWYISPVDGGCTTVRYVADNIISSAPAAIGSLMRGVGILKVTTTVVGDTKLRLANGEIAPPRDIGIPVTGGQTYTFSGYFRAGSAVRTHLLRFNWFTKTGAVASVDKSVESGALDAVGSWTRISHTATAPADAVYCGFRVRTVGTALNEVHYWDALQVEQGTAATEFEDARLIDIWALAPRVNNITNPSFELTTDGWTGSAYRNLLSSADSSMETAGGWVGNTSNPTRTTAQALQGTYSIQLTAVGAGEMNAINVRSAASPGVTPGQVYTAVASFRAATTPRRVNVAIDWLDANGNYMGTSRNSIWAGTDNNAGWSQAAHTAQAPSTASRANINVQVEGCVVGEVHYVDAVGLFSDAQGNLLANPDFENGLLASIHDGGGGATFSLDTTRAYTGRASFLATNNGFSFFSNGGQFTPATPGQEYTFSVYTQSRSLTGGRQAFIRWYGPTSTHGVNGFLDTAYAVSAEPAVNTWSRITVTGTAPVGTVNMTPFVYWPSNGEHNYDGLTLTATSSAVPYVPPRTHNLVTNPSVEVDTTGFFGTGGAPPTLTRDTTRAYVGAASLKVTAVATANLNSDVGIPKPALFDAATFYTMSAYVYVPTGMPPICWYAPGFGTGAASTLFDQWQRITYTLTGAQLNQFSVILGNAGATPAGSWWADAVQLEMGSVATPYVDGARGAAYKWNASENLITNPSFEVDTAGWTGLNQNLLTANQSSLETDTAGWSGNNATIARSTAQALQGSASLLLTASGSGNFSTSTPVGASGVPVTAGQVYTAVASSRAGTVGREVRITMVWYNAAGATLTVVDGPSTTDNTAGWTQVTTTLQAPATAAFGAFAITFTHPDASASTHYVDAIGLFTDPLGNLVTNPDFENGTTGWNPNAATLTQDTTQAYTGRSSMKVVPTAVAFSGSNSLAVALVAGQTFTFSAYVYSATAVTLRAAAFNGAFLGGTTPTFAIPANTWTRVSHTGVTSGTAGWSFYIDNNTNLSTTPFFVDAVQVVVGASAVTYLPPTTSNLVTNPSLEVDTAGWSNAGAGNSTNARSTTQSYVGAASLLCTWLGNATFGNSGVQTLGSPVSTGTTVTASCYVYVPAGSAPVAIHLYDGGGANGVRGATSAVFGAWQRLTATFVTSTSAGAVFQIEPQTNALGTVYLDAVQVEQGSVATPYVDGSLGAGFVWEASENLLSAAAASFEDGTTGGWAANGTATLANSAAQAFSGTKSLLMSVGATAFTAGQEMAYRDIPLPPANTLLTQSTYVRPSVTCNLRTEFYASGANVAFGTGADVSCPANTWTRISSTALVPAGSTAVFTTVAAGTGGVAASATVYIDAVQVEQKPYATAYNALGTANASTSVRRRPWVLGGTSLEYLYLDDTRFAVDGTKALGVNTNNYETWAETQYLRGAEQLVAVAPNTTYTLSGFVTGSGVSDNFLRVMDGATQIAAGAPIGGTKIRQTMTFTTGPSQVQARVQLVVRGFYSNTGGWVDAVQLEQRSFATAFGATGAANQATSTRQAPWTLGGTGATTITRTNELTPPVIEGIGTYVLRVDNTEGQGSGAVTTATLSPYTTYILSAYCRVPTGEVAPMLQVAEIGATGLPTVNATSAALDVGDSWKRLSLTFTTGGNPTYELRVLASSTTSVADNFYVDAVLLEAGNAARDYFDGSTYAFTGESIWEGGAHTSRSHYYPQRRTKNFRMAALLPDYTPMGSSFRLSYAKPLV